MSDTPEPNSQPMPPMPGSMLPMVISIAILIGITFGAFKWWQVRAAEQARSDGIALTEVGPPLTEFELTDEHGKPFRTEDMKGKVWVATYFFSTCPGSCIRLNQNIQFMHNMPDLKDVTWVSITCDPDNDTEEVLARYADQWKADPDRWRFVRGDLDYTKRVARGMNLFLERKGHQDYAIVIDKTGKIRGMYDATSRSQSERLHTRLLECLAEEPPSDLAATKDKSNGPAAEKNSS